MIKKKLLISIISCGLILSLSACGNYSITSNESPSTQNKTDDPFEKMENDTAFMGRLSHEAVNPNRTKDQSVLPYEYEGGEFAFEYQFSAEGNLKSIGFLLFLDGKPQAYKVDDTNADYEYCHDFSVGEKTDKTFTFLFTPNTGVTGDTLNLTVVSITNPTFQPDMVKSSSYGWYHQILDYTLKLHFNTAPPSDIELPATREVISSIHTKEEKVTSSFIENDLVKNGWSDVSLDTLDTNTYSTISYDGELVYDNINVSALKTLTVRYTLCGTAGADYGVSFFINHQPVPCDSILSYNATLTKGNIWIIEAVIDVTKLSDFNTFYVMAVPSGDIDQAFINKSSSILFYKEK